MGGSFQNANFKIIGGGGTNIVGGSGDSQWRGLF